jgi:hypothetical protein
VKGAALKGSVVASTWLLEQLCRALYAPLPCRMALDIQVAEASDYATLSDEELEAIITGSERAIHSSHGTGSAYR